MKIIKVRDTWDCSLCITKIRKGCYCLLNENKNHLCLRCGKKWLNKRRNTCILKELENLKYAKNNIIVNLADG